MREQLKKEAEAVTIFAKDRDNMARYDEDGGTIKLSRATFARLADLIARQDAYIDGLGWQPIETAPRDEQVVILLTNGEKVETGRYHHNVYKQEVLVERKGNRSTYETVEEDSSFWCGFDDLYSPTHWMPLPTPEQPTKREA